MACFFARSNFQIIIEFLYLMRYIKNKKAGMDLSGFKQQLQTLQKQQKDAE